MAPSAGNGDGDGRAVRSGVRSLPEPRPRRAARTALGILGLPLLSLSLLAQSTGIIAGRVYDEATGRSLQGAVVTVVGTASRDFTDPDGRYAIAVAPGSHALQVDYLGLDRLRGTVTVTAGATTAFDAPLKSEVLKLSAFEVRETARGQALAVNQQRVASGIVNIVSEETFGRMVDGNIGQTLQYLPSISMNEDQDGSVGGINIRGVENEYNAFLIDGNRISSRGFNTRNIAGDGITNIEVIKAPTPDRDGDAIGGMVNVVTRTAFQRDGRAMSLKLDTTFNDLPNKWGYGGSFHFSDLYSVGGGQKNLGLSFTLSHHKTDRYSVNADIDWVQVTPANNPALNLPTDRPVWFMEATHWEYDTRVTKNHGLSGSIDFRTDEFNSFYVRPTYGYFNRTGIAFETDIDIDTRFQDAVGGRKTYALLTPTSGRGTPGNSGSRGSMGWIGTDDHRRNTLYSVAAGGRHERADTLLTYDFVGARTKERILSDLELNMLMEPRSPWMLWEYELVAPWKGDIRVNLLSGQNPRNLSLMSEGELIDETSTRTEDTFSARADWERKFPLSEHSVFTFKTGAKHRSLKSAFQQKALVWEMDEDFPYRSVLEPTEQVLFLKQKYWDVYPRRGAELLRTNPALFALNAEDTLADSSLPNYDGRENVTAAYLMGTYQLGRHTFIGGVRWEDVSWSSLRFEGDFSRVPEIDVFGEAATRRVLDAIRSERYRSSYSNFLPGLHGRHALTDQLILRESYNRSYGKPRLSDLTMGRFISEDGDIEEGNPDLKPAVSDNFDLQLEYYTRHGGLYSAGVFYKDIKDFTYTHTYDFNDLDANGVPIPDADGDLEYEVPRNGSTAKNRGLELIARQRLVFLPGLLKNFSLDLSATFLDTEAHYPNRTVALGGDGRTGLPLPGFSDRILTSRLEYAQGNFRGRVGYRYRSDFVEGLGDNVESDEFFGAEERVEADLSYRLKSGLRLFASGTNLTNRPLVSYQGFKAFTEDSSYPGRKFVFGVEYDF